MADHQSVGFAEIIGIAEETDEDHELPSYSDKGWILVEILATGLAAEGGSYDFELGDVQTDGSAFWIVECEGMDFWLDSHLRGDIKEPGWYAIEDVKGAYYRGDGWTTDDDVDWTFSDPRRATEQEISDLAVHPEGKTP